MKKLFVLPALLVLLFSSGCIKKNGQMGKSVFSISNDLESSGGFSGNENNVYTLVKESAHSGVIACRIDSINKYGYLFRTRINQLPVTNFKKIKFSCWCSLNDAASKASLVISIDDNTGKQLLWSGNEINKTVKTPKEWGEVSVDADLSKFNQPDNKISIYVWNNSNAAIYSDDYKIEFFE